MNWLQMAPADVLRYAETDASTPLEVALLKVIKDGECGMNERREFEREVERLENEVDDLGGLERKVDDLKDALEEVGKIAKKADDGALQEIIDIVDDAL